MAKIYKNYILFIFCWRKCSNKTISFIIVLSNILKLIGTFNLNAYMYLWMKEVHILQDIKYTLINGYKGKSRVKLSLWLKKYTLMTDCEW